METVYINGKFTAQGTTGVQRVAGSLVRALDRCGPRPGGRDWVLLCPPGSQAFSLAYIVPRRVGPLGLPLHLWEQIVLPTVARKGLLLNLAGSAPWFARRQAALLHDAAVFDRPQAYTRSFVWWYRALFRRLAQRAVKLLTVSAYSRQRLAATLGVDSDCLAVVPNGGDHLDDVIPDRAVLAAHGLLHKRFLLAVASDNPAKNLPALLAAFALLPPDPALRLVIVGGRNERVFATGGRATDPPGVVRTGPLADASLKALYQHAVALVFPSLYEGFGLPPLEAMACGCPVAAARAASMPEVCGDAVLYFDPGSVDAIAAALQRVLGDTALCERLSRAGSARAAGYRWSESARLLLACLPGEPRA